MDAITVLLGNGTMVMTQDAGQTLVGHRTSGDSSTGEGPTVEGNKERQRLREG